MINDSLITQKISIKLATQTLKTTSKKADKKIAEETVNFIGNIIYNVPVSKSKQS